MTHSQQQVIFTVLFTGALWCAPTVHAAEPSTTPEVATTTGESPQRTGARAAAARLREFVVTATRVRTPILHMPVPTTIISGQELQEQQITEVYEALRDVPGFTIVQSGSRGGTTSVFVRGGESNYNLLFIDGVRANLAGGDFDYGDLATLGFDHIEIVPGPHSALYGSDAISSVIQLFTPRGFGPAHGFVRFGGGTFNTFKEQVGISGGTERYGYNLAVERIDTDGILSVNSDFHATTVASRFDFDPTPTLQLTSTVRFIDSRSHFSTGSAGDRFDPPDPRQYSDRQRVIFGTRAVHAPTNWWQQTLQLGVVREERIFRDAFDEDIDFGSFLGNTEERRLSADYTSHFFLPTMLEVAPTFSVGAYIEDEHFDQRSDAAGTIEKVSPSRNTQSFYTQLLLEWRERVFLMSGFRVDDSSTFGTEVTPRVSIAYVFPWTQTKLRGGYAQGIKAPTFVENFGIGSPFIIGNRALESEQAESWEIGLDQPISYDTHAALLSLTYFSTEYDDLIAFVSGTTPNFLNVQSVRSRGLEAAVRFTLTHGLSFVSSYTYLDTKVLAAGASESALFNRGKSLLRRPAHTGSVTVNYAWQRLKINFNITVKGDTVDSDFRDFPARRVVLNGYSKADLALAYRVLENWWGIHTLTLTAKVQNLFDEDYQEVFGFSSAGANFMLGFVAEF